MKRIFLTIFVLVFFVASLVPTLADDGKDMIFDMVASALAIGYPSADYNEMKAKYEVAKADPTSQVKFDAMQTSALLFLANRFNTTTDYPATVKMNETFNNADNLHANLGFQGAVNIVDGKYKTAWTPSLELFLKEGYENVKYEFALAGDSTIQACFGLRVKPGEHANTYGGGRGNHAESELSKSLTFDIINRLYPDKIAIGFNDGPMNESPVFTLDYPAGFNPKSNNTYLIMDYGNLISVSINGQKFCQILFQKSLTDKYTAAYIFNGAGAPLGLVEDISVRKQGGFVVSSRTGYVALDSLAISTFSGMYEILDVQPLKDILATAKAIQNEGYVTSTWRRLKNAIANAEDILALDVGDLTVAIIESAIGGLQEAIDRLLIKVPIGDPVGEVFLPDLNEQFLETIHPTGLTAEFLDLRHDGNPGTGGFILKFDSDSYGTKTLKIHYDCAHQASNWPTAMVYLFENGSEEPVEVELISNGNGAWGRYQDHEITINVIPGENEFRFASATGPAGQNVRIDFITLGALSPSDPPESEEPTIPETGDNNLVYMLIIMSALTVSSFYVLRKKREEY